jgi:hypothetical protein
VPALSPDKLLELVLVEESLFVWMAIHGNLCLALRHPANRGASRHYIESFVHKLGQLLIEKGVFTAEEIATAQVLEQEETPTRQGH